MTKQLIDDIIALGTKAGADLNDLREELALLDTLVNNINLDRLRGKFGRSFIAELVASAHGIVTTTAVTVSGLKCKKKGCSGDLAPSGQQRLGLEEGFDLRYECNLCGAIQ